MHVRKGDQVVVVAGKEKGKRGRVLRLMTEKDRVVIERINMVKRHTKPTQRNPRGGILEKEGFKVQRGYAGIPTAFLATWGEGKPVISLGSDLDPARRPDRRGRPTAQHRRGGLPKEWTR